MSEREILEFPEIGLRVYRDEYEALVAGAEERLARPLKADDLGELRARIERLKAEREA